MAGDARAASSETASRPRWGAVFSLSFGAFVLIASEFMPVSLLTPVAADLHVTEGQAGQAIAVSGAFAVLTSFLIARLSGGMDRRNLLLIMTALMVASGSLVSLAPGYVPFLLGRALIGIAIGGFWSMSAATAMRLVPVADVPRALAILNGGNALATVVAAPLGSFLGGIIGWRGAFFCVVPLAAVVLVWQAASLPPMQAGRGARRGILTLLRRPVVALGMAAVTIFFMGQFALFTYLRPFLETVTGADVTTLSLMLLAMGVAGFLGTLLVGAAVHTQLYRLLVGGPVAMAGMALALVAFGHSMPATWALLALWGFVATAAPVAWWSWLALTLPDDAEAGGGLMVGLIQLAITLGATVGGVLFDLGGHVMSFTAAAALLLLAAWLALLTARRVPAGPARTR
ncbi:MFS transporter [Rhodovarius crocodyli]|uniref:MFS transporter n=2 Tax=Rhodovarius crocodyli TaxID=1979269 RepID=A0A437MK39_9PROT|nr:MFS transporter [Rhodovarius crocodyli]